MKNQNVYVDQKSKMVENTVLPTGYNEDFYLQLFFGETTEALDKGKSLTKCMFLCVPSEI